MAERPVTTLTIPAPARMLTLNAERKADAHDRASIVRLWREAAWATALQAKVSPMKRIKITVHVGQRGSVLADAANHYPAVKACIDGLVDAKVIEDDGPGFVRNIDQWAPRRTERDVIVLELEEV